MKLWAKWYQWLWLHTTGEPYTFIMRRSAKEHPLYWILIPTGLGAAFYALITHLWGLW